MDRDLHVVLTGRGNREGARADEAFDKRLADLDVADVVVLDLGGLAVDDAAGPDAALSRDGQGLGARAHEAGDEDRRGGEAEHEAERGEGGERILSGYWPLQTTER